MPCSVRRKLSHLLFIAFASPLIAAESFESATAGSLKEFKGALGTFTTDGNGAAIISGHGKSGRQALRLAGQGESSVILRLTAPAAEGRILRFHAERWTEREPFQFRIDAREENGTWKEALDASPLVKVGGFLTEVRVPLPAGSREVRFRCTAPPDAGVLIDDLAIPLPGPARVVAVETVQPVCPAFIRQDYNPILGFRIDVEGSEGSVNLNAIELTFDGSTRMEDIANLEVREGSADPAAPPGEVIAVKERAASRVSLKTKRALIPGEHWFWVSVRLKKTASLDGQVDAGLVYVTFDNVGMEPPVVSPPGSQRIGYALRLPGDDGSKCYRIPGMVRSKAGTLVAAYDIRYDHSRDLPANIDVGVSRSPDGGWTWEPMRVAIDMGDDPKFGHDGVGDPAILADPKTGRLWITALWSHGNRSWNGSGPGLKPEETGQLVLVHSDDDGKTWSKPVNLTEQLKDPAWRLFFNGPGAGIVLRDGTLVFAAQYRAADGIPWSTLISSKDGGKTWQRGIGVKSDTTEAQVAELADGSIMINCRDNRGGSRTVATTKDLGRTWQLHPTDRKALREPVCMGSLLAWEGALWFSNPDSTKGRHSMTLKRSDDQGMSWPEKQQWLYDSREGFGYSCLAPIDEKHLGVIYEGSGSLYFLRLPAGD